MTHTSRANEDVSGGVADNESMEFLGDALLGFVIADVLFREFPEFDEGQKSKTKAALVSTTTLARQAERLGLGDHLLLGRGEEKTGGRRKQALLADGYEALIAAIYLDGGIEPARAFIAREFAPLARRRPPGRRRRAGLQVGAAGAAAVARAAAARVPPRRHARARSPQAVSGRGRRQRRARWRRATGPSKKEAEQDARARHARKIEAVARFETSAFKTRAQLMPIFHRSAWSRFKTRWLIRVHNGTDISTDSGRSDDGSKKPRGPRALGDVHNQNRALHLPMTLAAIDVETSRSISPIGASCGSRASCDLVRVATFFLRATS